MSVPVVTAMTTGGFGQFQDLCPPLTVFVYHKGSGSVMSVMDSTKDEMRRNECIVYWTATGFTC